MAKAISNLSTTWSNTSNIYTGIGLNVNGAAYNANSALIDLKLNSNSLMRLTSNGVLYINGAPIGSGTGSNVSAAFDTANAAFAAANAAGGSTASDAFNKANSANIVASSAYDKANSANILAFNTGAGANAFTSATIAGANVITIAAFSVANNANLKANLAWDTANAAFATANSASGSDVTAAFLRANVSIGLSSNDLVTFHTANSSNSGIANSSSYYSAGYEHWRAYDGLTGASDHWFSATTTGWIGYDFYESKSVTQYAITGVSSGFGTNRSPTAWTFEGSDDGIIWTVLDTISAQTWTSLEVKTFNIGNANNYFRYRVNVTTPVSGFVLGAAEINLRGFTQKATGAFNRANLASNTVNTIGAISNSAFNKANSANIVASSAYGEANLSAKLTGADFTGGVKANSSATYALQGYSTVNHGTHGQSTSASYGGVIGYAANGLKFGILGYANADALNGNGNIRIVHGTAGLYDSGKVLRIHNSGQYVAYANGTSVTLGSSYTTASYVIIYEANSGSSAGYFVGYNYVIKLANSPPGYTFANTDTASAICLFCSGHTLTLKNATGAALNMSVAIYSAYGVA